MSVQTNGGIVHFVDDNSAVRKSLASILRSEGIPVQTYASGKEILNLCPSESSEGCLILDLQLQDTTGIELYKKLTERGVRLPFIMLSGVGGVEDATTAMRLGAVDYLQKPIVAKTILPVVRRAFRIDRERKERIRRVGEFREKLSRLTKRESQVLELVVEGKLTKQIAKVLSIADKTVDVHRSNITKKVRTNSVVELVRKYVEYQRDLEELEEADS